MILLNACRSFKPFNWTLTIHNQYHEFRTKMPPFFQIESLIYYHMIIKKQLTRKKWTEKNIFQLYILTENSNMLIAFFIETKVQLFPPETIAIFLYFTWKLPNKVLFFVFFSFLLSAKSTSMNANQPDLFSLVRQIFSSNKMYLKNKLRKIADGDVELGKKLEYIYI